MEPSTAASVRPAGFVAKSLNVLQWIVFIFMALCVAVPLTGLGQTDIPGAPIVLLYVCIAVTAIAAIVHLPLVFRRLPKKAKKAAYLAILPVMILVLTYVVMMQTAYEKTPEGAKEAAAQAAVERQQEADAAKEAATQAQLEATQRSIDDLKKLNDKLEGCFSTFGHHLPKFESAVRDSLENPHSFEHVKTTIIVPDSDGRNVVMEFRAENGFGALRTAQVRARLYPDDCLIDDIGPIENE